MNSIEKIGKFEVIALFITIISNNIIINISTIIVNNSSTGAWLNIIYLTLICLVFIFFICKFFKPFINSDILDVSEFLGGKILKTIMAILYVALFIISSATCIRYFSNSLKLIYFNYTPLVFLILLMIIPVVIANRYGLKGISGANLIFLPVAVFSIITLFFTASQDFVWERLFPALGYGAKETFLLQITNIFAFDVIGYLYFLKPFLKKETDFKKISIIAVILCGLYLLLSIISLLMSFAFIMQTDETLSLYLLTRLISFGNFLQRVDAIFIFIWILTILSYLSLNLFIITQIIKKTINLKSTAQIIYPIAVFIFSIGLLFKNIMSIKLFISNFYNIYSAILIFIISFIILLLAYIKKKKKQGVKHEI